jgi:tetratricopeptide (TPR) repeat protein
LGPHEVEPKGFRDMEKSVKKYIHQTLLLLSKGKLKKAKETIEFILSKGYEHSDAYFLSGEIDRQLGIYDIAEQKLLKALTMQVYTPKVYFSLGLIYNFKQEYDKSIRCFKKFLFTIETPEAHFELGKALMAANSVGEAAIHFNRAVILDPEEPNYYLERAKCYEAQGLNELAQEDYQYVLKIDPTYHLEHVAELRESEEMMDSLNASRKRSILNKILA